MALKRGASHLGFVLAFVIFVMFLIFMYSAVEPVIKTKLSKEAVLENLKLNFERHLEENGESITIMTLVNTSAITSMQKCINLRSIIGSSTNEIPSTYVTTNSLLIKDSEGKNFNYSDQGSGDLRIGGWPAGHLKNNGYELKVYYSGKFNYINGETQTGCDPTSDYIVESLKEEPSHVFDSTIADSKSYYESLGGYDNLKFDLGIPSGMDFTFSFDFLNGTVIEPESVIVPNTDVYTRTFPVEYLDSDANLKIGLLNVKIW